MDHHEISPGDDDACLILQGGRKALDEIEQTDASPWHVREWFLIRVYSPNLSSKPSSRKALRISSIFCFDSPPFGLQATLTLKLKSFPVPNFVRTFV
jgi:hypothetical protein